jgi:serine/threonine-protein kinase PpkA
VPQPPAAPVALRLLVVHDDLSLRLRIADLLAPHCGGPGIDTCGRRAAIDLGARLRDYAAAVVVVDFAPGRAPADALTIVRELRALARGLAIVVIGSGGSDGTAVKSLRAGAHDYWPLHTVDAGELVGNLRESAYVPQPPAAIAGRAVATLQVPGYRIRKELARSPRAVVCLADSDELPHPVAIKIHRHGIPDEASREEAERFMRECRLLAQFNQRAIADVYDFGADHEQHWLAMEYFPCGSLKARLQHPLTESEALAYAGQLGQALAAIHAAGIVHRDLKPSNIMVRADDSLALIDFGLARPALAPSSVTSPNVRVGSPYYMAPEQIDGLPPDARCDLYALGIVFYELLTGQLPYAGQSVAEVLEQHRRARTPRLPDRLLRFQPVLERLLAKRPPERLPSASAFLEALATASAGASSRSPTR